MIQEWKKRSRVRWDANGEAERTGWKTLLDMVTYKLLYNVEEMDQGAVSYLGGGSGTSLSKCSEKWYGPGQFGFPHRVLRVLCGYFEHQSVLVWQISAANDHSHPLWLEKVSSALRNCDARCNE